MTNTYLTGNPLGSKAPRDLYDNASNLDDWTNGPLPSGQDRFLQFRLTWKGMEVAFEQSQAARASDFAAFLLASGYEFIGDYDTDGPLLIERPNQVFSKDGEYWRSGPSLVLPYTTVNNWVVDQPKFVSVGDAVLRSQLGDSSNPALGSNLIGYAVATAFTGQNLHSRMATEILVSDFFPQYGGDALGLTDCTAATQAAIDYALLATTKAKTIVWPAGRFLYPEGSPPLNPHAGDLCFKGAGRVATVILFEEGTSSAGIGLRKNLFYNYDNVLGKGALEFSGMTFQGNWSTKSYAEGGGTPLFLGYYKSMSVRDCKFYDLSFMATACEGIKQVHVVGNIVDTCARDGIRFRNCFNCYVGGNYLARLGDDSIALHANQAQGGVQTREGIIVEGNIIEGAPGVRVLSGRMVQIRGNTFRRVFGNAISVYSGGGFPTEADSGVFGVDIKDNQIFDMLPPAPFTAAIPQLAIAVFGAPQGGSNTSFVIPGQANLSTGTFVMPWNHRNGSYSNPASSMPAPYAINIEGNTVARTLPAGAAYSAWNYGLAFSASGPVDTVILDSMLRPAVGIQVGGDSTDVRVSGNNIGHVGSCIAATPGTTVYAMRNWLIEGNSLHDFMGYGFTPGTPFIAGAPCDFTVSNNTFSGDPFHISTNRGAGGTWQVASVPAAFDLNSFKGGKFLNNKISNVAQVWNGADPADHQFHGNICRAELTMLSFSTSNKGIGGIGASMGPNSGFIIENFYSDPTVSTYGNLKGQTLQTAPNQPSTGFYVAGTFVHSYGNSTIYGWYRLTNGSSHTPGTDWKAVAMS